MAKMLVDGAKLDACNTAEADAIRAKTGGSSPIPYDYANNKGFADAIAAIPSGGGDGWELISDFTASEDVATINMEIPSAKRGMNVYKVQLTGETSASEWIYVRVNGTGSQTGGYYLPQIRQYSTSFIAAKRGYGNAGYAITSSGNSGDIKTNANIENIFMNLYNASSRFKSGFNVKLWGIN